MTHAARIAAAQHSVIATRALYDVLTEEIHRDFPAPADDAAESEVEAWIECIGQAEIDRGHHEATMARVKAEDELLAACEAWTRVAGANRPEMMHLFDIAGRRPNARSRTLDLFMRLDTSTIAI